MMKVVRCIAEGEILGAECNTFQYVTDVVISSEKNAQHTHIHVEIQPHRQHYESTNCISQKLCVVKLWTNKPRHLLVTGRQVAANEAETGSVEHERDGGGTLVTFTPDNTLPSELFTRRIQPTRFFLQPIGAPISW